MIKDEKLKRLMNKSNIIFLESVSYLYHIWITYLRSFN